MNFFTIYFICNLNSIHFFLEKEPSTRSNDIFFWPIMIQTRDSLRSKPHGLLLMKLIVIHDIDCDIKLSLFSWDRPKNGGKLFIHLKMYSVYPQFLHLPSSNFAKSFSQVNTPKWWWWWGGGPSSPHPQGGGRTTPPPPALPIEPWGWALNKGFRGPQLPPAVVSNTKRSGFFLSTNEQFIDLTD